MRRRSNALLITILLAALWAFAVLGGLAFFLFGGEIPTSAVAPASPTFMVPTRPPPPPTRTPLVVPSPAAAAEPASPTPEASLAAAQVPPTPVPPAPTPAPPLIITATRPPAMAPTAAVRVITATPRPPAASAPPSAAPAPAAAGFRQSSITPPPVRITIAKIGVDAPIVVLGIDDKNIMEAPPSAETVGWYNFSAAPGSPGNAVMSGHVDRGQSIAVFWRLKELTNGDTIVVYGPGGESYRYFVSDVASYSTAGPPVEQILGPTGYEALTLITCDGAFNPTTRLYDRRLIVRAVRG